MPLQSEGLMTKRSRDLVGRVGQHESSIVDRDGGLAFLDPFSVKVRNPIRQKVLPHAWCVVIVGGECLRAARGSIPGIRAPGKPG